VRELAVTLCRPAFAYLTAKWVVDFKRKKRASLQDTVGTRAQNRAYVHERRSNITAHHYINQLKLTRQKKNPSVLSIEA